jgi:hypothetical protein
MTNAAHLFFQLVGRCWERGSMLWMNDRSVTECAGVAGFDLATPAPGVGDRLSTAQRSPMILNAKSSLMVEPITPTLAVLVA